jgi:hypothetical protein
MVRIVLVKLPHPAGKGQVDAIGQIFPPVHHYIWHELEIHPLDGLDSS